MKKLRIVVVAAVSMMNFVLVASQAGAQDRDAAPKLGQFRDILRNGQAIYLRVSSNNPLYSVQLLTDDQAAEVRMEQSDAAGKLKRLSAVEQELKASKNLEEQATLILEANQLQTDISRSQQRSRTTLSTYYEVQYVAADYVALKRNGVKKYIPFRSILAIEQRETLIRTRRVSSGRGSSYSRGGNPVTNENRVQLKNLIAAEVAKLIKKKFADDKFEIKVNETTNSLTITAVSLLGRRIQQLIEQLDFIAKKE